ncbi:hypothetical protein ILUMI_11055 [Ignelater luminosus]|uniref:Uncharacterized protein n=1 Tax=Ignelater luminosus TaxID=2038154 RepID=A0A8K0G837_IGNLU|nr:hypothetical protein ILUMI_11055 [Ignelater luminosus]
MDLFLPIVLFIVFCVLFSICGWCCKKHREGTVYGYAGQPNVTVSSQPASAIVPPYPVDARHAQPQPVPPVPGFTPAGGYQTAPYPTATPYPPAPAPGFYPMPIGGGYPPATPYPVNVAAPYPTSTPSYPPASAAAPYPPASAAAPYPPAPGGAPYPAQQQPPSYMEAVGQPPAEPHPINEAYSKQSPYNPHY